MYELLFTNEPREDRSPLHLSVQDAIDYAKANAPVGTDYEVWQVADDTERTRVCLVLSARVPSEWKISEVQKQANSKRVLGW